MWPGTKKQPCPRCGSPDTIPIVHGQPRPDLPAGIEKIQPFKPPRVGIDDVDRVCRKCGHQWRVG
jgi:ribosomal protein S27AE